MKRFSLPIFGADKREFGTSILVALIGFALVWILSPPIVFSFHSDYARNLAINLHRSAWHFVVAFISLLCAINAFRDEENEPNNRFLIITWCLALVVWMLFLCQAFGIGGDAFRP